MIKLGPVEVRLILKGVLDNCHANEMTIDDKYSEVILSIIEFDQLLNDPSVRKITSLRLVPKSEYKKLGIQL